MPRSEAENDTHGDLVRGRFRSGLTDCVRGVEFARGVAAGPLTRREAELVAACHGTDFEIVGPWSDAPTLPPPALVSVAPPRSAAPAALADVPRKRRAP